MADAVVAVSQGTRSDILRLFNVDPARVRIIYNGIDPEEYHPRKSQDLLPKNGIDPNKPYISFVGRIARQKGNYPSRQCDQIYELGIPGRSLRRSA